MLNKAKAFLSRFIAWKWQPLVTIPVLYLFLCLITFVFGYCEKMYDSSVGAFSSTEMKDAFTVLLIVIASLALALTVFLLLKKKTTARYFCGLFILGASMVIVYFSFTRYMNYMGLKHDYGAFSTGGHWAIIYDIYTTGKIPDVNLNNQYYQPKLWHTLIASLMKFNSLFIKEPAYNPILSVNGSAKNFPLYTMHVYMLLESTKPFIALVGILTIYLGYRIFKAIGFEGKRLAIATFLLCATPVFWYIPWYGNNDSLALLFMMAALYFALSYRKKRNYFSIIMCAVTLGLGMETKLNSALIAFPVAFIFLLELIKVIKEKKKNTWIHFAIQIGLFAILVFPIGLFGTLYNYIVYQEPIGYVLDLEANGQNFMHIDGNTYNIFQRFLSFPNADLFFGMFNLRYNSTSTIVNGQKIYTPIWGEQDFNVWTAFLKTALWGEGSINVSEPLTALLTIVYYGAIILGVLIIISFLLACVLEIMRLAKKEKPHFDFWLLAMIFVINAFAYCYFAYKYPVGCSTNARYAMILFLPMYAGVATMISQGVETVQAAVQKKKLG